MTAEPPVPLPRPSRMPDDPAFIRAIAAAPADDAPRLVYADVLDERGDEASSARAEFIRVQIERARLTPLSPRWNELWHRDTALLDWARTWREELPLVKGVEYGGFLRGFVDKVEVWQQGPFLAAAATVFNAVPVARLHMHRIDGPGVERLVQTDTLATVVELRLAGVRLPEALYQSLADRGPWQNLARLAFEDEYPCDVPVDSPLVKRLLERFKGVHVSRTVSMSTPRRGGSH